jgi:hypothetical protein
MDTNEMIRDPQNQKDLEFTVVEREGNYPSVLHVVMKLPLLLSNRDFVLKTTYKKINERTSLFMAHSTKHPDFPERKDYVRLNWFRHFYIEQIGTDLKQTVYTLMDFGGSIPTVINNMIFNSLAQTRMNTQVKQIRDIQKRRLNKA